jgi:hypothetical protein
MQALLVLVEDMWIYFSNWFKSDLISNPHPDIEMKDE